MFETDQDLDALEFDNHPTLTFVSPPNDSHAIAYLNGSTFVFVLDIELVIVIGVVVVVR